MNIIVIHYGEIGIKGKNRPWFEKLLVENIKKHLKGLKYEKIKRIFGRIIVEGYEGGREEYSKRLKNVFGIVSFSFGISVKQDMDSMKKGVSELIKEDKSGSYRVVTKRSNKKFALKSPEVNREIGKWMAEKYGKVADYVDADEEINIEIVENYCFLFIGKVKGLGGMPVGASGKVVVLLSGGIDSPVASWYMMKRGCKPVFLHFHSHPYTSEESQKKVEKLSSILSKYYPGLKIYFVPFIDIQKEIMTKSDKKYRVVLYRRYMMRIAEKIARKENCKALVSGENLAQVASQTTENMASIQESISMVVFRPLIGFDKQEIIDKAKEIGTYEISIEPHEDCCSLFVPKHPATKSGVEELEKFEKDINPSLVMECVKKREKKTAFEDGCKEKVD